MDFTFDSSQPLEEFIEKTRGCALSTAKKYKQKINQIALIRSATGSDYLAASIETVGEFIKWLKESSGTIVSDIESGVNRKGEPWSESTRANCYKAIIAAGKHYTVPLKDRKAAKMAGHNVKEHYYLKGVEDEVKSLEDHFNKLNDATQTQRKSGVKTEKQKKNWISWSTILEKAQQAIDLLKHEGINLSKCTYAQIDKGVTKRDDSGTNTQILTLQRAILASLYTDVLNSTGVKGPRRSEYVGYIDRNGINRGTLWCGGDGGDDTESQTTYLCTDKKAKMHNWLVYKKIDMRGARNKGGYLQFILNHHKTSDSQGSVKITIDNMRLIKMLLLLRQMGKERDVQTVFNQFRPQKTRRGDENYKPPFSVAMTPNNLTSHLNAIFSVGEKKISVDMLRTIYLTEKYGPIEEEKKEVAKCMGHSLSTQQTYIKSPDIISI